MRRIKVNLLNIPAFSVSTWALPCFSHNNFIILRPFRAALPLIAET